MNTMDVKKRVLQNARVVGQQQLCREHYRLTLQVDQFPPAVAGQFVHLSPPSTPPDSYREHDCSQRETLIKWRATINSPMLRRAFSIAGLTEVQDGIQIDVIYRVVGTGTKWMESLSVGDTVSVLGPLGNHFPMVENKQHAWCVAGGVGLPPMLWLAQALNRSKREAIAFCGAQTTDLLALTMDQERPPSTDAKTATLSCTEFNQNDVSVVISTDDGSLGFHGHIGAALTAYYNANPIPPDDIVVYTCGPERMLEFVSNFCAERSIECYVCLERGMACGTGMCQSCVVPLRDDEDTQGWIYQLCCTQGPIFDARKILWDPIGVSG